MYIYCISISVGENPQIKLTWPSWQRNCQTLPTAVTGIAGTYEWRKFISNPQMQLIKQTLPTVTVIAFQ